MKNVEGIYSTIYMVGIELVLLDGFDCGYDTIQEMNKKETENVKRIKEFYFKSEVSDWLVHAPLVCILREKL